MPDTGVHMGFPEFHEEPLSSHQKPFRRKVRMLCGCFAGAQNTKKQKPQHSAIPRRTASLRAKTAKLSFCAPFVRHTPSNRARHRNLAEQKPVPKRRRASRNFSHKHKVNGKKAREFTLSIRFHFNVDFTHKIKTQHTIII